MILLVDNYDSFTFNLQRYLDRLGQEVVVLRNDSVELDAALQACSAIVLSPGPRAPNEAGRCLEIIQQYSGTRTILGICLGHQAIFQAFGGTIVRAERPIHGRDLPMDLDDHPLFGNIPTGSRFARYHSLVGDAATVPACLKTIAWSSHAANQRDSAREIMAVAHRQHATFGVQFHPESILSAHGYQLLANFLAIAGLARDTPLPNSDLVAAVEPLNASEQQHQGDAGANEHHVVLPRLLQPNR